ncbi:hypothetical protein ABT237_16410 [Streptomyces sp. NPDC001581]|uniref:hypothetical protein n=1 Tax=Streptomyces sp. NPDC001581 TaxID=3154386 RepID=UPI0033259DCD
MPGRDECQRPLPPRDAEIVGARFTPSGVHGRASRVYISDTWRQRGTFRQEEHPLLLDETASVRVLEVRTHTATGAKPFTLYTYSLDPYPGFLVNGYLVRAPS